MHKKSILNFIYLLTVYLFNLLYPIIIIPLLTSRLGIDGFGKFSLLYSCFTLSFILCDYSFTFTGVRDINDDHNIDEHSLYNDIQNARLLLVLISSVIFSSYILYVFNLKQAIYYFISSFIGLIGYCQFAHWYHQAKSDLKINSILTILSRCFSFILIFILVNNEQHVTLALYLSTTTYILFGLISLVVRKIKYKVKLKFSTNNMLLTLKNGFNLFFSDFLPNVYNNIPVIILGGLIASEKYAIFSVANKISIAIATLFYIVLKALYPRLCENKDKFSISKNIIPFFSLALLAFIFMQVFGEYLITSIFGSAYAGVQDLLTYMTIGLIFISISSSLRYSFFLPRKHDKEIRNVTLIMVSISAVFVYATIGIYKEWAVIFGVLIARFISALLFSLYAIKLNKIDHR
ncbi:lipopolysaccharide biosynthesis protein [Kistimonas asteriae]|uniref:lipopolysaccharide biosynthesis protein n=1 Tax=Kistimonas asteriae TaxID=517724 RepID=UPI001BAA4877|nr:oligosaccharide flippase family protein [Kistimonas asteriae]